MKTKKHSKTTLNLRVDEHLKNSAEEILNELGISMTSAVIVFLKALVRNKGIPFSITTTKKVSTVSSKKSKSSETIFENNYFEEADDFEFDDIESLKDAIDML